MNFCLGEIGIRHADLRKRCIQIGEKLGVFKDYATPKRMYFALRSRVDRSGGRKEVIRKPGERRTRRCSRRRGHDGLSRFVASAAPPLLSFSVARRSDTRWKKIFMMPVDVSIYYCAVRLLSANC